MSAAIPELSVVVATHNRADRLEALLESLKGQSLPRERFEVVAIDDCSSDATAELLEREAAAGELVLSVRRRELREGPAAARNDGWRAARAPVVAFTDDDCLADAGWLDALLRAAAEHPGAVVQGRTDPNPAELHLLGPFSRTLSVHEAGPYFQTCNILYPRDLLERLGGFDASTYSGPGGEDTDLAWRAIEEGAQVAFAPQARVFHAVARLGPVGKLRVAARWSETMRTFADHPALRRQQLTYNLFWKGSHYLLVRALLALLLPRRLNPLRRWLAYPYLRHLLERGQVEGGGPLLAPYFLVHDLVELVAVMRGALRYRTPVL